MVSSKKLKLSDINFHHKNVIVMMSSNVLLFPGRASEKPSLFRVNRTLLLFLASRLGFLLSFYFVYAGPLLNATDFFAEIS